MEPKLAWAARSTAVWFPELLIKAFYSETARDIVDSFELEISFHDFG